MSALSNAINDYGPHILITTRFEWHKLCPDCCEMVFSVMPVKCTPCFYKRSEIVDKDVSYFHDVVDDD